MPPELAFEQSQVLAYGHSEQERLQGQAVGQSYVHRWEGPELSGTAIRAILMEQMAPNGEWQEKLVHGGKIRIRNASGVRNLSSLVGHEMPLKLLVPGGSGFLSKISL